MTVVNLQIAKRLNSIGFDEIVTTGIYETKRLKEHWPAVPAKKNSELLKYLKSKPGEYVTAPDLLQVVRWLFVNYDISVAYGLMILTTVGKGKFFSSVHYIYDKNNWNSLTWGRSVFYKTPEEALMNGIKQAIKLIQHHPYKKKQL